MKFKSGDIVSQNGFGNIFRHKEYYKTIIILNIKRGLMEDAYLIASYPESNNNHSTNISTIDIDHGYDLDILFTRDKKIDEILK